MRISSSNNLNSLKFELVLELDPNLVRVLCCSIEIKQGQAFNGICEVFEKSYLES